MVKDGKNHMVYDGDVLSFGELRKALKIAFPDQPQNERDLLMLILWGAVLSNRRDHE